MFFACHTKDTMSSVADISGIPVVDFGAVSLGRETRPNTSDESVVKLVKQIHDAFSTIGFVYLKNHGISQEQVDAVFGVAETFFNLHTDVKSKYSKKEGGKSPNGWDAFERERTNPDRPADLKESFDIGAVGNDSDLSWPDADVPEFKPLLQSMYHKMSELGHRVLSIMAIGLGLDQDAFKFAYQHVGKAGGLVQLRLNYYPRIQGNVQVKPNQIRCGEHTDYGGITLLFQDHIGGLQVRNLEGGFVPAIPMRGTILVNISDLMQRWTSDKLRSTVHRVLLPEDESKLRAPRQSIAFFFEPDYDALIKCLDGSNKYPPITCGEYVTRRWSETYRY